MNTSQDVSQAKFWWGISFLCNLVAVWFIQPLMALMKMAGHMEAVPASIGMIEIPVTGSATVMAEVLCLVAILVGIAAASRAASEAG